MVMKLNKMVFDDKKIEAAANKHIETEYARYNSGEVEEEMICLRGKDSFKEGAKWAINEFLKDLCHSIEEEPKHDKQITYVWGNGIAKTIILNEEADKFNRTPSQIWHNICKNYKVVSWLYIDDLFPEEGGNQ